MLITLEEYKQALHGYSLTDCVVRDRSRFTFVATRHLTDVELEAEEREMESPAYRDKRVLPFMRDDPPGDQWGWTTLHGWDLLVSGAALVPENRFVGVDLEGHVWISGGGVSEREDDVPAFREGGPRRGGIRKVKTIAGYAYICGGERSVGKRTGKNTWVSQTQAMQPHPEIGRGGFQDIDGFAEDDLYAVGGKADVWHFDGQDWRQLIMPTNTWTEAVCCGGDGQVYITCTDGLIIAGRSDRWRVIGTEEVSLGFRDLVWYEDRVWCANDYGIWTIHDSELKRPILSSEVVACAGHLDANDGVLLVAGLGGAAFKENGAWQSILLMPELAAAHAGG